jgi:CheY-specific phosphatase CheX
MEVTSNDVLTKEHIAALRDSVTSTFQVICGSPPEFLGESPDGKVCVGVLGMIALVGDLSWSLTLGLPRETSEALACKFSGLDIEFDSEDMSDVVGELANVLSGDVAARLDALRVGVKMSLPTVARGKNLEIVRPGALSATRMRFATPQGEMWIGLAVGKHP